MNEYRQLGEVCGLMGSYLNQHDYKIKSPNEKLGFTHYLKLLYNAINEAEITLLESEVEE